MYRICPVKERAYTSMWQLGIRNDYSVLGTANTMSLQAVLPTLGGRVSDDILSNKP